MASTQFGLILAAGGASNSATLSVERGILESVSVVPDDLTLPAGDTFVAVYLLQGGLTLAYAIARLGADNVTALEGPQWSGLIHLKPNMAILAIGQSTAGSTVRIGLNIHTGD